MKLEKNRQFEYNLNKIADNHPRLYYYELTYTAVDNSKIYAEVMVYRNTRLQSFPKRLS